jgi:hypothetical protein
MRAMCWRRRQGSGRMNAVFYATLQNCYAYIGAGLTRSKTNQEQPH